MLSSIKSAYVLSNPFPPKPPIVFSPYRHAVSLTVFPLVIRYFSVLILSNLVKSPDVNKNKGVAEMAPFNPTFSNLRLSKQCITILETARIQFWASNQSTYHLTGLDAVRGSTLATVLGCCRNIKFKYHLPG